MESDFDRTADEIQASIMEEARKTYSEKVIQRWLYPRNAGTIERPDGYARFTGPCGDTMEIFLQVRGNRIVDAKFLTDGCATTIACGDFVASLARSRTVQDARKISPENILDGLGGLPESDQHCALLASTTLQKAIGGMLAFREES